MERQGGKELDAVRGPPEKVYDTISNVKRVCGTVGAPPPHGNLKFGFIQDFVLVGRYLDERV